MTITESQSLRVFLAQRSEEEKQANPLNKIIGNRMLESDISKENVRDLLEMASLVCQQSGLGTKNLEKLLNIINATATGEVNDVLEMIQPYLKQTSELFSLGAQVMSVKVASNLMSSLDLAFEDLLALKLFIESRGESTEKIDELMDKLNWIKEESHQKLLKEQFTLRSAIVDVGLTSSQFVIDKIVEHVSSLNAESIDLLNVANDAFDIIKCPLELAVKIHRIYMQKELVEQLKLLNPKKYSARIQEIEAEILSTQISAAKTGIRGGLKISIKVVDVLTNPTVAKITNISANVLSNLSKAAVIVGVVDGTIGLGFKLYSFVKKIQNLQELKGRIRKIEQHSNKNTDKITTVGKDILRAKAHCLKSHGKVHKLGIIKKGFNVISSAFGLVASINGILALSGIVIGTTAATVLSATGIGAAVMAGVAALIGAAIVIYKNRHYFEYIGNTWKQPIKKLVNNMKMSHAKRQFKNAFGTPQTPTPGLIAKELKMRERIRNLEEKRKGLDEISQTAEDYLELRKMQSKLKGWNLADFERLTTSIRNELNDEEGRKKIEALLAKYQFVHFEELSVPTVMRFILSS